MFRLIVQAIQQGYTPLAAIWPEVVFMNLHPTTGISVICNSKSMPPCPTGPATLADAFVRPGTLLGLNLLPWSLLAEATLCGPMRGVACVGSVSRKKWPGCCHTLPTPDEAPLQ